LFLPSFPTPIFSQSFMQPFKNSWFTDRAIRDSTLHVVLEVMMDLALGITLKASTQNHALRTMAFPSIADVVDSVGQMVIASLRTSGLFHTIRTYSHGIVATSIARWLGMSAAASTFTSKFNA
jgi:hypothetical protein